MKCVTFVSDTFTWYGSNITNVWQEILTPMTLAKLCTKNYENPSIFVKVAAKKSVAPFYVDTVCIYKYRYIHCESEKNWNLFHLSITLANTVRF